MPLVEQHRDVRPESCEVCRYLDGRPELDRLLQHTLTTIAGWVLLQDLREAGGPLSMRGIYVERFAADSPGRSVSLDPHHWLLALLAAPEVKLSLTSEARP